MERGLEESRCSDPDMPKCKRIQTLFGGEGEVSPLEPLAFWLVNITNTSFPMPHTLVSRNDAEGGTKSPKVGFGSAAITNDPHKVRTLDALFVAPGPSTMWTDQKKLAVEKISRLDQVGPGVHSDSSQICCLHTPSEVIKG